MIAVIIGMVFHLSSAGKVSSIDSVPDLMSIQVGSRLEIPCRFSIEDQSHGDIIELEWGVMPKNGGAYRSLFFIYNPNKIEVMYHADRVNVSVNMIQRGNCSLVIDPIISKDSGFYDVHIRINGQEPDSIPVVYVNVSDASGLSPVGEDYDSEEQPKSNAPYITAFAVPGVILLGFILWFLWFIFCQPKQQDERQQQDQGATTASSRGALEPPQMPHHVHQ